MAVTSQVTTINDLEGSPTFSSIGGGAGATANTDVFIQGSQSGGRRSDNVTDHGFWLDDGGSNDISATGTHVGFWVWQTHYAALTAFSVRIGTTTSDYKAWTYPLADWPALGGWLRIWVDVSAGTGAGSGLTTTQARYFAIVNSIGDVAGNASNLILDAVHNTTGGLLWTGSTGSFADFVSYDTTNRVGVVTSANGVIVVLARLTIGSATATTFTASGFALLFPDQPLISSTFAGLTWDLQNASTVVTLTNGSIVSADPTGNRGDFVVTGTSGSLDWTGGVLTGARVVTLTSGVTLDACKIGSCGLIDTGGATITGCSISGSTATSALKVDSTTEMAAVTDCSFTSGGTGHAIELTVAGTYTFDGITFSGYSGTSTNAAVFVNVASGSVTLNIVGGDTPSVRTAGASVTINNAVNLSFGGIVSGSRLYIEAAATVGSVTSGDELYNEVVNTDPWTSSFNFEGSLAVIWRVRKASSAPYYAPAGGTATITSAGLSVNVQQILDQ